MDLTPIVPSPHLPPQLRLKPCCSPKQGFAGCTVTLPPPASTQRAFLSGEAAVCQPRRTRYTCPQPSFFMPALDSGVVFASSVGYPQRISGSKTTIPQCKSMLHRTKKKISAKQPMENVGWFPGNAPLAREGTMPWKWGEGWSRSEKKSRKRNRKKKKAERRAQAHRCTDAQMHRCTGAQMQTVRWGPTALTKRH